VLLSTGAGPLGHPKIYINLVQAISLFESWGGLLNFLSDRTNLALDHAGELISI
jgi:hypothetical protein